MTENTLWVRLLVHLHVTMMEQKIKLAPDTLKLLADCSEGFGA